MSEKVPPAEFRVETLTPVPGASVWTGCQYLTQASDMEAMPDWTNAAAAVVEARPDDGK
jgi:hypothetical protein